MRDPHEILGVPPGASVAEIKDAYRRLAVKYHPDKHADNVLQELAEEKFREIKAAYDKLVGPDNEHGASADASHSTRPTSASQSVSTAIERRLAAAIQCMKSRRFADALSELDWVQRELGWDVGVAGLRGMALSELGRHAEAIPVLERVLKAAPTDESWPGVLAMAYRAVGRHQDAADAFRRQRSIAGDIPDLLAAEGIEREAVGDKEEAARLFTRLREQDPAHQVLKMRDQSWHIGGKYVDKQAAAGDACILCAILNCVFDCC